MSKKNLIFIYPKLYTFIQTEIKLLSDEFNLISINQNWERKILLPFNLIRQVIFLVINIRKVDTILISFGGYWSFFPALFSDLLGKKVAIVMHGTDCVSFPEIEYGNLRNPILSFVTKKSLQWASIILPVSESLVYTENNYYSSKTLKFGYNYHLSNIKTPYKVIHNGLNILDWVRDNEIIRNKTSFVTVLGEGKIKIKGVDLIIEVASRFPNSIFYLAGIENWGLPPFPQYGDLEKALNNIPKNVPTLLMSHDPSHWEAQVIEHSFPFELTLSGHTHGMQFGIEIPGWFKWSPVKWRYKQWAGVYNQAKQYLNVNRGFGFLAYPGRVGIWPEITVITLKCSQKVV